tara:strand:+ start:94 stop:672 length:579 start_codon:yes stop_codon:yes gene_type:complete
MTIRCSGLPVLAALGLATLGLSGCAPSLADDVDLENVAPPDIVWIDETPIYPNATIAENIAAAPVFSKLAMLVDRAGLGEALAGEGPITIFAPTDDAFAALPPHTDEALRETLGNHVIAGRLTATDIQASIVEGGGSWEVATLSGGTLSFRSDGDNLRIKGGDGATVQITMADLYQSNGMMHVIDGVLLPKE